ncbi:alpha/beta fold hydrolase [Pseudoruegeria sp. HB172150]|uniref:alpha/beta fold hydrolase n=1 Tax=Pseudoruegeria sp. HB172150 TaxID=2721164 RepID=UPI0015561D4D|nr:alpha/beta hydrolase [Pseudoruegeria sp. HB172150]
MTDPLVLIPSLMCDARAFLPQIVELSWETAVHVSAPLHGSTVEDMATSILTGAPQRFALCGHGLGGIVAMEILRRAPDRVSRVALMSTGCQPELPQVAATREALIVAARAGRVSEAIRGELKPDHLAVPDPVRSGILDAMYEMAEDLGPELFQRQSRAMQKRPDQQGALRKARTPALILCGEDDPLFPLRRHEFMAHLMPNAKLDVVAGAGHLPALENPSAVSASLRNWLSWPVSGQSSSSAPSWS